MNKKVSLLVIIFLLFMLSIFSGCQQADNKNANLKKKLGIITPKPTLKPTPVMPIDWDKKDKDTIVIFFNDLPEGYERIVDEVNIRTRDLLGINVVFRSSNAYISQKKSDFLSLICSYDYDAIVTSPNYYISNDQYSSVFRDITKVFPEYAPQLYSKYIKDDLAKVSYSGNIYGIPCLVQATDRYCVEIRKDLVEKYSIEPIKTFDDYENFLEMIKKNEPDLYPCYQGGMNLDMFIEPAGYLHCGSYFVYPKKQGNIRFIPWDVTDSFVDAVNTIERWQDKGYFMKIGDDAANINKKFASFISKIDGSLYDMSIFDSTDYVIYPLYPDISMSKEENSDPVIMINNKTIKTEKVLKFIEWAFSSQENFDLLMYGIQGEDYEFVGDGIKMLNKSSGGIYNGFSCFRVFQNLDYMRNPYSLTINLVDIYKQAEETSRHKPTLWFNPGVNSDAFKKRVDVIQTQQSKLLYGYFDLNALGFRESQQELGVNNDINYLQKYWEEWRTQYKDLLLNMN